MQFGTRVMRKASHCKVGDRVCFDQPSYNYVIEEVETTSIGQVRHIHGDGTASNAYWPHEILWTEGDE